MSSKNKLSLSLIIPVYNQEQHLDACLEAVMAQTEPFDEVIVVNNNSTDSSVDIAKKYSNVKIVHEKKPGLIAARNHGFNAAKGDVICRIDSDTELSSTWAAEARRHFVDHPESSGLTGLTTTHFFVVLLTFQTTLWCRSYFVDTENYFGVPILWGANMAIRREAWQKIKNKTCHDEKRVHEDQDISLLLAHYGFAVHRNNSMHIHMIDESYASLPKYFEYAIRRTKTKRYHKKQNTYPPRTLPLYETLFRELYYLPAIVGFALIVVPAYSLSRLLGRR